MKYLFQLTPEELLAAVPRYGTRKAALVAINFSRRTRQAAKVAGRCHHCGISGHAWEDCELRKQGELEISNELNDRLKPHRKKSYEPNT